MTIKYFNIFILESVQYTNKYLEVKKYISNSSYFNRLARPNFVRLRLADVLDSLGSKLPALGVTYPPPSTAMGIIYSRSDFLIGSPVDAIVSLSES